MSRSLLEERASICLIIIIFLLRSMTVCEPNESTGITNLSSSFICLIYPVCCCWTSLRTSCCSEWVFFFSTVFDTAAVSSLFFSIILSSSFCMSIWAWYNSCRLPGIYN